MKKFILIPFALLMLCLTATNARNEFPKDIAVGVNGGVTMSSMRFQLNRPQSSPLKQGSPLSPNFGVSFRYIQQKHFGILVELKYCQKGWSETYNDPNLYYLRNTLKMANIPVIPGQDMKISLSRKLNYIELPFLTHLYFGNKVRVVVNLGPQIGYMFSDSGKGNAPFFPNVESGTKGSDLFKHYTLKVSNRFDYGITGGAGMEFRIKQSSVVLEGRYYFGLSDIFPNNKRDYFAASSNQNIYVNLSYLFRIK